MHRDKRTSVQHLKGSLLCSGLLASQMSIISPSFPQAAAGKVAAGDTGGEMKQARAINCAAGAGRVRQRRDLRERCGPARLAPSAGACAPGQPALGPTSEVKGRHQRARPIPGRRGVTARGKPIRPSTPHVQGGRCSAPGTLLNATGRAPPPTWPIIVVCLGL